MFRPLRQWMDSQTGSAFIITLWLVAMIGVMVTAFTMNAVVNTQMSEALNRISAGSGLARAGIEAWMGQLRADAITADVGLVLTEIMNYYPPSAVRINEVDFDSTSGACSTPSSEAVEIFNAAPEGSGKISVDGWTVKSGGSEFGTLSGSLAAGDFQVVTGSSLTDGGDLVTLHNNSGKEVDRFEYTEDPGNGQTLQVLPDGRNGIKPAESRTYADTAWVMRDCTIGESNGQGMWAKVGDNKHEGLKISQFDEDGNEIASLDLGADVTGPADKSKWVDRYFIDSSSGTGTFVLTGGLNTAQIPSTFNNGAEPSAGTASDSFNYSDTTMYVRVDVPQPVYGDTVWSSYGDTDIIAPEGSFIDQTSNKIATVGAGVSSDAGQLGYVVRMDTSVGVPDNVVWGDTPSVSPDPGSYRPSVYTGTADDYVFDEMDRTTGKLYVSEVYDTFSESGEDGFTNPSFETEDTSKTTNAKGWETGTTYSDPDAERLDESSVPVSAPDGSHVLGQGYARDLTSSYGRPFSSDKAPVTGGEDYTFKASSYGDGGSYRRAFRISWYDGSGSEISTSSDFETKSADSWEDHSVTFTAPDAAEEVEYKIETQYEDSSLKTVYWDEVNITGPGLGGGGGGGGNTANEFLELMLFGTPDRSLEDRHEFVELVNTSSDTVDLSGASIKDTLDGDGNTVSADDYNFKVHPQNPGSGGDLKLPPGPPAVGVVMPTEADSSVLMDTNLVVNGPVKLFALENASSGDVEFFTDGLYDDEMEDLILDRPSGPGGGGTRRTLDTAEDWDKLDVSPWESRLKGVIDGGEVAKNWSPSGFGGTPGKVPGAGDSYWDPWGWKGEIFSGVSMGDTVYLPSGNTSPAPEDIGGFRIIRIEDETGKLSLNAPTGVPNLETPLSSARYGGAATLTSDQAKEVVNPGDFAKNYFWKTPGDLLHLDGVGRGSYMELRHVYSVFRDTSVVPSPMPVNVNTASYEALRGIQMNPDETASPAFLTEAMAKKLIDARSGDKSISSDDCLGTTSCDETFPELSEAAYPEGKTGSAFTSLSEAADQISGMDDNFNEGTFFNHAAVDSKEGKFTVVAKGFTLGEEGKLLSEVRLTATVDRRPVIEQTGPMKIIYMREK